jgi:hypothetical protein
MHKQGGKLAEGKEGNYMKKIKGNLFLSFLIALILVAVSISFTFAAEGGVKNVQATPGVKSVELTWDAYDGAHHYGVYYAGQEKTLKANVRSCIISGLSVDTQYGFRIKAYDSNNKLIATSYIKKTRTLGVRNVTNFKAHAGNKSITVTFKKVPYANYYELYRKQNGKWKLIKKLNAKNNTDTRYDKNQIFYRDTNASERNVAYFYRVRAIRKRTDGSGKYWVSSKWSTSSARPVRQMYQEIKVNGSWHTANGYSGGRYYTLDGYVYDVNRVSRASCDYSETNNYTNRTAENFVNELTGYKKSYGKSKMVWISTYTQHLYVFEYNTSKKMWKIKKHWECSTGKAGSATPMSKNFEVGHNHKSRHGIRYWSCFSSHNGMHGLGSYSDHSGEPVSGGCVRNPDSKAEFVYYYVPVGARVVSW